MQDNGITSHIAAVYEAITALREASLTATSQAQAQRYAEQVNVMSEALRDKLTALQGKLNSFGYHGIPLR